MNIIESAGIGLLPTRNLASKNDGLLKKRKAESEFILKQNNNLKIYTKQSDNL